MIRLGITGHRFLAEQDRIVAGADQVLGRVREAFPGEELSALSPLAEGADRLVVHRFLCCSDARLVVPLPLPKDDYVSDFESAGSKEEFLQLLARADEVIVLPPRPTWEEAYEAAGQYVLDHSDVLIAVWDGQEAQARVARVVS